MDNKHKYIVVLGVWISLLSGLNVLAQALSGEHPVWLFVAGFVPPAAAYGQKWYGWLSHQVTGEMPEQPALMDLESAERLADRHLERGVSENA